MADNAIGPGRRRCHDEYRRCIEGHQGHEPNEFIRGPKWRTRTSPAHRALAAVITFALITAVGGCIVGALIAVLWWLGAPTLVAVMPWAVPTAIVVGWVLFRPTPAVATDDDDDSWPGYAIQYVLVGESTPRTAPARVVAAVLVGAPVTWALLVFGLSTLTGLM